MTTSLLPSTVCLLDLFCYCPSVLSRIVTNSASVYKTTMIVILSGGVYADCTVVHLESSKRTKNDVQIQVDQGQPLIVRRASLTRVCKSHVKN